MISFHFDLGDSTHGPIGMCARVRADSREQALERLQAALPEELTMPTTDEGIEYLTIYFNPDAITDADIDDEDEIDEAS